MTTIDRPARAIPEDFSAAVRASGWGVAAMCGLFLIFGAGLFACSSEAAGNQRDSQAPVEERTKSEKIRVHTLRAKSVQYRATWEVRGVLEPLRSARVAFILGGRLTKVLVERGDEVEEGQLLAQLDRAEVGAAAAQARAAVSAADAKVRLAADALHRLERLDSTEAVPRSKVVEVRIQHEAAVALRAQARAALQMANVKSGQHLLRSPIDGTVLDLPEQLGEIVGPGIPQFEIADLTRLRFRGALPEEAVGQVKLDQQVELLRRNGQRLSGAISYLSPALSADSHRLPFEVETSAPEEHREGLANAYVRALVRAQEERTVARVPATSIVRGDVVSVFVVDSDEVVHEREVTVLRSEGDFVLVSGVDPNAEIVNLPPVDLEDGARVDR